MLTIISRFAPVVVAATLVALAATGKLFSASAPVIALQILAVALAVWARRSFPESAFRVSSGPAADAVIRRGPYRLIRHPMYAAALLLIWVAVFSHITVWTLGLGLVVTGIVAVRIGVEERALQERYSDYSAYAHSTKAVIPFLL